MRVFPLNHPGDVGDSRAEIGEAELDRASALLDQVLALVTRDLPTLDPPQA